MSILRAQLAGVLIAFTCILTLFSCSGTSSIPIPSFRLDRGLFAFRSDFEPEDVAAAQNYLLGVGRADITGPVVEINFMGYADTSQVGTGLRQRLYTRAFIVGHPTNSEQRFVYLVLDTANGDTAIRNGIIEGLRNLGGDYSVYTKDNVAVTGTHSHSGPGAWLNYLLPQITSLGFSKQSYNAIVQGSIAAVQRAHASLTPGYLELGITNTSGISINRSPYAYLQNPAAERAQYDTDTDTDMTLLKFTNAASNKPMGVLTWIPVHGTSLYQNNTLATGDNKGVAAYLLEQSMASVNPDFVGGFSQAHVGDTTPNVLGAYCEDTGLPCRFNDSTCGGKTQGCHGRGPVWQVLDQGTQSCYEIGRRQFQAAQDLMNSGSLTRLGDPTVAAYHTFVDMSTYSFTSPFNDSRQLETCSAALGYSFAGGTSDGPGAFDFVQGLNESDKDSPALKNPLWKVARAFLHQPSEDQVKCQRPKPILLDVGAAEFPYAWSPNIVDIQSFRVGPLLMIIAPGEATTMSGRRWRQAVAAAAQSVLEISDPHVVIGGPANTYAHYIATEEEYQEQRYEGASTLYGPHELAAYVSLSLKYLPYLSANASSLPTIPTGPQPPINTNSSLSFISGVVLDSPGLFKSFGQPLSSPDPLITYQPGSSVTATFVGANPRNNLRLDGTFAAIERLDPSTGKFNIVRDDRDWHLVYQWKRTNSVTGESTVTITWEIEGDADDLDTRQKYRMHYYGDAKVLGRINAFEGVSGEFWVGPAGSQGYMDGEKGEETVMAEGLDPELIRL